MQSKKAGKICCENKNRQQGDGNGREGDSGRQRANGRKIVCQTRSQTINTCIQNTFISFYLCIPHAQWQRRRRRRRNREAKTETERRQKGADKRDTHIV